MDKSLYNNHLTILHEELIAAMGCTEPIAIAYVSALAQKTLGSQPVSCEVLCSGNIVKNVMGVVVPKSEGQRGIAVAAVLGIVGGNADQELQVLESITSEDVIKARQLVAQGFCTCQLAKGVENLFVEVHLTDADGHRVTAQIKDHHNNVTLLQKDDTVLISAQAVSSPAQSRADRSLLSVKNILEFADCTNLDDVRDLLNRQVLYNCAISQEGLQNPYGAQVGRTLLAHCGNNLRTRAKAAAAAGSDARMGGCPLPVVINSGSGNQGLTITLPIVEYAREYHISEEKMLRALIVANLTSVHQKKYIGSLSAYCGATSAACGSAVGIAYMLDKPYDVICRTITNTIATIGGMVCDGAKSSCAAKIAAAVECALVGLDMACDEQTFQPGEGLVKDDVESTIQSIGRMGRVGMHETDIEILNIMLGK